MEQTMVNIGDICRILPVPLWDTTVEPETPPRSLLVEIIGIDGSFQQLRLVNYLDVSVPELYMMHNVFKAERLTLYCPKEELFDVSREL